MEIEKTLLPQQMPASLQDMPLTDQLSYELGQAHQYNVTQSQAIGYTLLNRHMLGEVAPIIEIGGFMSEITSSSRQWAGIQLATLERPVLQIDLPGHGTSSPVSARQGFDWVMKRSADSQVAPIIETISALLPDEGRDYFGYSQGALYSLISAGALEGSAASNVLAVDVPGTDKRITAALQINYIFRDGRSGKAQFLKEAKVRGIIGSFEEFEDNDYVKPSTPSTPFFKNNPGIVALNLFASANARPIALPAIDTLTRIEHSQTLILTGSRSSVSSAEAIQEHIDSLTPEQQDRIQQRVIEGDHNITDVRMMPWLAQQAAALYQN